MSTEDVDDATRLLQGIVPDELLTPYKRLLETDGCPSSDAPDLLGGQEAVDALIAAGMAYALQSGLTLSPRLVATAPDLALQGALAALSRKLVAAHERLLDGQRRMAVTHPLPGVLQAEADRLVRILTDGRQITDTSRALLGTARREWLVLENFALERPLEKLVSMPPPPTFEGKVRCRNIYQASCAEHPVGYKIMQMHAEAGEEARILPKIGMKMKLADEAVALIPLTPTGLSGALLVRSPIIVGALREYFELLWQRAVPLGAVEAEMPLKPIHIDVLKLLADGLTDARISRRLGVTAKSTERYLRTIREYFGVSNRTAIGAAAARRGWI